MQMKEFKKYIILRFACMLINHSFINPSIFGKKKLSENKNNSILLLV